MAEGIISQRLRIGFGGESLNLIWMLPGDISRVTGMAVVVLPGADQVAKMQASGIWSVKFGELSLRQWKRSDIFFQIAGSHCTDHRQDYGPMNLNAPGGMVHADLPQGKAPWFLPDISPELRQLEIHYRDLVLLSPPNGSPYFIDLLIRYNDQ